jgi:predicted unusual protein kinase regulating ubiquinone biosynthesis (AarF/ABC1/UbiB family)
VRRSARLWRLTLRNAIRYAWHRVAGRRGDELRRHQLDQRFAVRTAQDVARELGQMRGVIMKAGQMASVLAEGLPEEARAALATLQADAPPMAPSLAAEVVARELGEQPERCFLDWQPIPVAAASIGQVHRAVTDDGAVVAVKVQYPGAAEAITADLDNADALYRLVSMFALKGLDSRALVNELRDRMGDELDYRREAEQQRWFAHAFHGHPALRIPAVIDRWSTGKVLTTEWVDGWNFDELVRHGSPGACQRASEAMWRFAQHSLHRLGRFNGDPHPGNFRFDHDGTVTCLDFGMVKQYAPGEWERLRPCLDGIIVDRDPDALVAAMLEVGFLERAHGLDAQAVYDYVSAPYRPYLTDEFTFAPGFLKQAMGTIVDVRGPHRDVMARLNLPASFVVLNRVVWGVSGVLSRLHAHGPWRAMIMEYLKPDAPPATEMGAGEMAWWRGRSTTSVR